MADDSLDLYPAHLHPHATAASPYGSSKPPEGEGHGGVVDLRSEPGFGTEVSLRLPVGVPAVEIEPEPRDVPLTAALDLQPVIDVSAAIRRLRVGA